MPYLTNTPTINANVIFTYENNMPGTVGIAWVGTICFTNTSYRASVNEYFYNDALTAWVSDLLKKSRDTYKPIELLYFKVVQIMHACCPWKNTSS